MVKLILNKKYKTGNPGDIIEASKRLEELLVNKGMAHYAPPIPSIKTEITKEILNGVGDIIETEILKEADKLERAYDVTASSGKPKVKKPRKPRKKKADKFKW